MNQTGPATKQNEEEVYITLAGPIDAGMAARVFSNFTLAINNKVKRVHLLIQSTGGIVGDGIGIYNFLKNLPIEIITYNGGSVSSIAVLVYAAGKVRKASGTATFMIHKAHFSPAPGTPAQKLDALAQGLRIEDERIETILKSVITMPKEKWDAHALHDLTLTADEAKKFALAHEISDFKLPVGMQLYNI